MYPHLPLHRPRRLLALMPRRRFVSVFILCGILTSSTIASAQSSYTQGRWASQFRMRDPILTPTDSGEVAIHMAALRGDGVAEAAGRAGAAQA